MARFCLSGPVGGNFGVAPHVLRSSQIWGQFAIRGVNSCFACGGREGATVQTGAAQTGGKKVAGTKTANTTPLSNQPGPGHSGYLAQIYWPPPCALRNLNNFAKANKAFCRFWCLGQRDANIGGVAVC